MIQDLDPSRVQDVIVKASPCLSFDFGFINTAHALTLN